MKRLWSSLLAVLALAVLAVPARADILWEPFGDKFFEAHRDEIEVVRRYFLANGEEGFVTLWDAPGGRKAVAQYENGEKLLVYDVYRDWGLVMSRWESEKGGWEETYGWTPLEDLSLVYDHISFREEYGDQIRAYRDELRDYDGDLSVVNFYEYPGAPEIKTTHRPRGDSAENYRNSLTGTGERSAVSQVFTDEEGRTWGYVDYFYGQVEGWFCLEDPAGTDFPVRQVPEAEYVPPQPPAAPAASWLPWALVGGVTAVTAGLLYWFYGRRRKEPSK